MSLDGNFGVYQYSSDEMSFEYEIEEDMYEIECGSQISHRTAVFTVLENLSNRLKELVGEQSIYDIVDFMDFNNDNIRKGVDEYMDIHGRVEYDNELVDRIYDNLEPLGIISEKILEQI